MSTILTRPEAPVGSVTRLNTFSALDFNLTDAAILCRNTAPLIEFALALLRRGIACHVVGKDIQVGLDILLDKCAKGTNGYEGDGGNKNETQIRLREHAVREGEKLRRKGKKEQAATLEDKCTALSILIGQTEGPGINAVKAKLKAIFANGDGITLSTIHKAKGLEWETVFLLDWHLLPSRYAETKDELTQERNLQYVAVTRAKLHLKYIKSENWK